MKVVILAGGFGTRIRDVPEDVPKPMISIGNHPIIWHIMKIYSYYGYKNFVVCLGYKGDRVRNYFLNYNAVADDFTLNTYTKKIKNEMNYKRDDWKITFAETGLNSNTGARVFRAKKYLEKDDYFALTYEDGVSDININELVQFHKSHKKLMTVTGVRPPARFGELQIDGSQVISFNEKPQTHAGWISGGFFICSRKVLDFLTTDDQLIFEKEPIEAITKAGQLMVYKHKGFWHPMDTSREYQLLNNLWNKEKAPWKKW